DARRARGAHFTPRDIAERLVAFAFDGVDPRSLRRVLDPSCGGGAFLPAAAEWLHRHGIARVDAAAAMHGADIDPLSVWVTATSLAWWGARAVDVAAEAEARVRCIDMLGALDDEWPRAPVDAVVGNPPFQNQLETATARTA